MINMITRDTWTRLIRDFRDMELPAMVERDLKLPRIPIRRAVSILGPRRCGKTYFMFQTVKKLLWEGVPRECILYVNFESDLLAGADLSDMRRMIEIFYEIYPGNKKKKIYLFLDEIQNVGGWEKFVRSVMDSEDAQVFISGSSSRMLSKEIATALRGRTLAYSIYPFNFTEFLKAKGFGTGKYISSSEKAQLFNLLEKFIKGSYPEVIFFEQEREKIMREITDVTIYRDIVERFKIKNLKVLKLILKGALYSKEFSVHRFHNYLKSMGLGVSKNTVYAYLDYFSDSMVLHVLRKYSGSYKETEQTIPKVYFIDNGFLSVNGIEDKGRLMENAVFAELIKRNFTPNKDLFYFRSGQKEADFIIKSGRKVSQIIQVCYSVDDAGTKERELGALAKASDELGCGNLVVITWDYENTEMHRGKRIRFVPMWKWLLGG